MCININNVCINIINIIIIIILVLIVMCNENTIIVVILMY